MPRNVSVLSDVTGGINITLFSYDGRLDVGIIACPTMVPDVWAVVHLLDQALDELKLLAEADDHAQAGAAADGGPVPAAGHC